MVDIVVIIICIVLLILVTLISYRSAKQVAWSDKMRRLNAGVRGKAEWMAPDYVTQHVRADYLSSIRFLRSKAMQDPSYFVKIYDPDKANVYLSGEMLAYYQRFYEACRRMNPAKSHYGERYHIVHYVDVRQFSDDGETCFVIDRQTQGAVELIESKTYRVISRQALDPVTVVYGMRYDRLSRHWKIDKFVQQFNHSYPINEVQSPVRIALVSKLSPKTGPNEGRAN